jgi:hypothetical protein
MSTPAKASQKKTPASKSSAPRQQTILGFFQKKSDLPARPSFDKASVQPRLNQSTPVPSSDPPEIPSSSALQVDKTPNLNKANGLLTPATSSSAADAGAELDDSDDIPVRKVLSHVVL